MTKVYNQDEYPLQDETYVIIGIAKLEIGLIINFNEKSLQYKRVINK